MKEMRDVRWCSLDALRNEVAPGDPSLDDRDGVLRVWLGLHDELGPRAIGAAINYLDREDERLRVNGVRYYTLDDLERGLAQTLKGKAKKKLRGLLP